MDRDLLFGVIAVQLGQATATQVMAATSAYVTDPSKGIAERLRAEGVITAERFEMLSTMVDEAIRAHGGDVSQTMQSLGGEQALYRSFGGSLVVDREGQLSIDPGVERGPDTQRGPGEDSTAVTEEAPGRYRLEGEAEIGRGGIGRVLVAFDEHVGRQVAIKELLSDSSSALPTSGPSDGLTKTSALAARFLREARVTGQLEHPNIMPVYEVGQRASGSYYYSMKLVRGRTLSAALDECQSLSDRLELLDHFVDLCNAMAYAHSRGVIHRDLKPDNAMLGEFGETVLLDWGLAKIRGKRDLRGGELAREIEQLQGADTGKTVDGAAVGTPAYMSPEQADGAIDEIDEQSDVWSLGAVLYEILTGRPPFEGVTPFEIIGKVLKDGVVPAREVDETVPAALSAVADKALCRDKAGRYETAAELAREIRAYMAGGRIGAYDYSTWELIKGVVAKHRAVSALVGLLAVSIALSAVFLLRAYRSAESARERAELARSEAVRARDEALTAQRRADVRTLAAQASVEESVGSMGEAAALLRAAFDLNRQADAAETSGHLMSRLDQLAHQAVLPRLLPPQPGNQVTARFAAGGRLLASASEAGSVRLWELSTGAVTTLLESPDALAHPTDVQFASKASRLALSRAPDSLQLWDTKTRKLLRSLAPAELGGPVSAVSAQASGMDRLRARALVSPVGDRFGTLVAGRTVVLATASTGKVVARLEHEAAVTDLAQDWNQRRLLTIAADGSVRIFELATGALVRTLQSEIRGAPQLWPSRTGRTLAIGGSDRVEVWDLDTGSRLGAIETRAWDGVLIDQDRTVLAASRDGTVRFFDVGSGQLTREIRGHSGQVRALAVTGDERFVVTGSQDQTAKMFDAHTGAPVRVFRGMEGVVNDIAVSSDDKTLVTTSPGGHVAVWALHNEALQWTQRVGARIYHHAWSADGRWLATASKNGEVHVWNGRTGVLERAMPAYPLEATGVVFNADGSRLATSSYDGRIRLYAVPSFELVATLELGGRAWRLSFSADGARIAAAAFTGQVAVWDVAGELVQRFERLPKHGPWWALFHDGPDGSRRIATYGWGNRVVVHEVGSGQVVFSAEAPSGEPSVFGLSPKTRLAAAASSAGELTLWDLAAGRKLTRVQAHESLVRGLCMAPEGERVLTYGRDSVAKIWDARTGKLRHALQGHQGGIWDGSISPDGALAATSSEDDTVRVWRTKDGTRLHTFPVEEGFLATVTFSADSQRLSVTTNQGGISVWRIDRERQAVDVLEQVGRASNLRTCRDSFETVKVVPFPAPHQVWAPAELCQ